MYIRINANINKGYVRERNEDIILVASRTLRDGSMMAKVMLTEEQRFIAAIADGIGGYRGGDIASEEVVDELSRYFYALPNGLSSEEIVSKFKEWVQVMHAELLERSRSDSSLKGMGTTLVSLFVYEGKTFWMNCGDSRLYRLRNDILCQLSTDHSLQQMAGNENAPSNVILNSIGAGESVFIDIEEISNAVFNNDTFMLCSDGITDALSDELIEAILTSSSIDKLLNVALTAGGNDNASACLLKFSGIV